MVHFIISIHAPRVGGDTIDALLNIFKEDFNPRPPCGGRQPAQKLVNSSSRFQSTPPVWGATLGDAMTPYIIFQFQSTPPVWGATFLRCEKKFVKSISIHAPRVGGDQIP